MIDITPFLGPAAGLINGFIGARGASRRQKLAIDNQWQMFQAQIKHQNEVNDRAMSFQREMNQRNEDWNTESNVRQRIEDAGYNPYLYQNGAMASNVNQSTPLAQNVAPTSPVDLPDPFSEFAHSAIDSVKGIADILLTKQNTRNIAANAANEEYMLGRQKKKDNYIYAGNDLPTAEAQKTHVELENAYQLMLKSTVESNLSIMTENVAKSPAFDENDQPITDESGRQLMMKEVSDRSLLKSNEKLLDKIKAEIRGIEQESDLTKVKKKLEQFNLDHLAPAQVKEVYATIDRIESEIIQKKAAAEFIGEQTKTERVQRIGEEILNGIKAKDYMNYDVDKWFRRFGMMSSSATSGVNAAANLKKAKQIAKFIK
ncbi:MAG: hypothetical protein SPJ90_04235 [Prevotella sp.]|nr:hypothetical protein [Prevotellaceae bacterium]MDY5843619.1 hypothetical protein [Prevotella sp.]